MPCAVRTRDKRPEFRPVYCPPCEPSWPRRGDVGGDHKVEVRVFDDAHAEALVTDSHGKAIAEPQKAKVTLHANAKGAPDGRTAIALAYEPATARFAGSAAAKADLEPAPIGPEMGGTLVVAGKYGVELAARGDGEVEAIVRDAAGVKLGAESALKLEAKLATAGGGATNAVLAWDAPSLSYEADVDAKLDFAATPITVAAKVEPVSVQKSAGASAKAGFSFGTK